jgi:flagellin-specific chaperone FliS
LRERAALAEDALGLARAESARALQDAELALSLEQQRTVSLSAKIANLEETHAAERERLVETIATMKREHQHAVLTMELAHDSALTDEFHRHAEALERLEARLDEEVVRLGTLYDTFAEQLSAAATERSRNEVKAISSVLGSHAASVAIAIESIVTGHARETAVVAKAVGAALKGKWEAKKNQKKKKKNPEIYILKKKNNPCTQLTPHFPPSINHTHHHRDGARRHWEPGPRVDARARRV